MRHFINIITEASKPTYEYAGNCTNGCNAPHLADMIDQAQEVSYRTLISAVGLKTVAEIFPDFDWSAKPRYLTMARDPIVSYYRSYYDGKPCYYIRESGIEHIFVMAGGEQAAVESILINAEGSFVTIGEPSVFAMTLNGRVADITQSVAATPAAAKTLMKWLSDNDVDTVIDSGDEQLVDDFVAWLQTV